MNKKAVIFDLDGTLLNTLEDLTDSTNYALEQCGFTQRNIDEIRQFVGNGVSKLIERAVPENTNNNDFQRCLELFKKHYQKNMFNQTKPYKGIIQMLQKIKLAGLKTAVVSNKFDLAVNKLCKKYFPHLIDFCAGENEPKGIRKKPAPDTVIKVLKNFDITPYEAIYVGDSEVDIQTAINSGIDCISVLWGFKDREFLIKNGAKILISNPDEIFKYL